MRVRLAATHPIQYQVPWFRGLAASPGLDLDVGFAWLPDREAQGVGFGVGFEWDVPLLEGYSWTELERAGGAPDLERFSALRLRRPGAWLPSGIAALIVTGWHRLPLLQLVWAARRRAIPVLARGDSPGSRRRSLPRRLSLRLLLRSFAGFLVVGSANRRFYGDLGVESERLFACPHFVDNRYFAERAAAGRGSRSETRRRWGLGDDEVGVLFCGKLIPEKNVDELLMALSIAAPKGALRLIVVGDGPLRPELERRALELGVGVAWDGFRNQSELPALYAAADLLVLPSRSETWGLVVNEALACGLPVVASDRVGCVPDLVLPGETGEVYPSGDPRELADRLLRLGGSADLRRREGERGRRLVFESFSVERAVEGTVQALAAVSLGGLVA